MSRLRSQALRQQRSLLLTTMTRKMSIENAADHWEFLDEIEAPMWADLGLESNLINQDIDDDWFHRAHKFHQLSSHKLKSSSRTGFGSLGVSSPALPQSVTKSRGSDYKSKKWGRSNHVVPFANQRLIEDSNGNSSKVYSGSGELKNRNKSRNSEISGDAKVRVNRLKAQVTCWTSESGSTGLTSVENSRMNIVTSECIDQQQKKTYRKTSRTFGKKSVLQSAEEISVRKSFVNRPAIRAEASHCKRESRDRQSSSGKSSVGSSSNPGHSLKCSGAGLMKKELTADSSSVMKISEAAKHKSQVPIMRDASNNQVKGRTLSSRRKVLVNITNQTSQEASYSKVQPQTFSSQVMTPLHIDEQKLFAASSINRKVMVNKLNKIGFSKGGGRATTTTNRIGFSGKGAKKGEPWKVGSKMHSVAPKQVKVSWQ